MVAISGHYRFVVYRSIDRIFFWFGFGSLYLHHILKSFIDHIRKCPIFHKKVSTSIHNLNADKKLGRFKKIAYFVLNFINNLFPTNRIDPSVELCLFNLTSSKNYFEKIDQMGSPSRILSQLFLVNLPWLDIKKELGNINILDIGCGSGLYGERLSDYSGGLISSYKGIDIAENPVWKDLKLKHANFSFEKIKDENILSYIPPKTNLFFSQSSLEHLDDVLYFNQIKEYTEKYKEPIIQIHLVPPPFGLWLYLLHGIRQYTPRNISKLTGVFSENDKKIIYQLGGKHCNRVHFKFITWPSLIMKIGDKRKPQPMIYKKALEDAIVKDQKNGLKHPAFYAFIIHSHPDNKNVFRVD